ncbi:Asp-tRNA(Asn)/Glu-tRNA(Gln) amidotransferase subunit GatB [Spirochaeta cellobiosiphila]|uniref:Asp-tRNA(Asn)/Glu-tRNA(Gln) amidotransferase subunit GatB n=1 Tax=Spirochaeta cellobiosiphila TaxID=504483 RepID=UPI00041963CB|nr:Asp-tRNA(Asn)/Glu-tRNA(Gln) amidotransferase subunit GatB [Spirochaeta cellobiosiphila]
MYESFVGLEIHIHLLADSKMFCSCKAQYGDEENTNVCPVCLGYPGVLPTANEKALELAYTVAEALNCELSPRTTFERKNYFYPDMPKNYQISQFEHPVGKNGWVEIEVNGEKKKIRIHDVHLEEDAGKMIHAGDVSLIDYNRAGYPLLEIVTEPDLVRGEDAEIYLKNFQRLVRYLGVSDGNMEEGSLRCDANVSINLEGQGLGRKVEIKNLNSSRFVKLALNYEIDRQSLLLDEGKIVSQETRLWNENRDITTVMRSKEQALDYRYFPEPDLPPFCPSDDFLQKVKDRQVELPLYRKDRFIKEYQLTEDQTEFIIDDKAVADYFEQVISLGVPTDMVATWLSGDVQKELNKNNMKLLESPLSPERFAELLKYLDEDRIHGKLAKQTLSAVFDENKSPGDIIAEKGWEQISNADQVQTLIEQVLADNQSVVDAIKSGDDRQRGYLMGQIMKKTNGRINPQIAQKVLSEKLG